MNQPQPNQSAAPIVTTSQIWNMSLTTAKKNRPKLFALIAIGFWIPQLISLFVLSALSEEKVASLKALTEKFEQNYEGTFYPFFDILTETLMPSLAVWMVVGIFFVATYLAIIELNYQFHTGRVIESSKELFLKGLKASFPGGIILAFVLPFLFLIGQLLIIPGIIVFVMGILAPVLLMIEKKGGFKSIWLALTARVSKLSRSQPVQVFFALSGVAVMVYVVVILRYFFNDFYSQLDLYLSTSRDFFQITLFGTHITLSALINEIFDLFFLGIILAILPLGGSSCYLLVKRPNKKWIIA